MESCGKLSIGEQGSELVRIVVSASPEAEGRRHSENFMGCTVQLALCILCACIYDVYSINILL